MVPSHVPPAMLPRRRVLLIGLVCLLVGLLALAALIRPTLAQQKLTAAEAKDHIGETQTVCGTVVSTHYAASTKGRPRFLNLEKPYPNQIFTILIWGSDRGKFGDPEARYANKRICVTGIIKSYRGVPEVIAEEPNQIAIDK